MSDQERAAMQQALEALESWRDAFPYGWMSYTKQINDRQALEALRAALAQKPEPVQEPVAWNWMLDGRPYGQAYYGNPPDADIAERAAIAGRTVRLLYAKPFGSKPLTDGEIAHEVYRKWGMLPGANSVITEFARAIERKVRGETE